jgi:hypothetical protein
MAQRTFMTCSLVRDDKHFMPSAERLRGAVALYARILHITTRPTPSQMPPKGSSSFRFRQADSIGAAAAEDDEFLKDCFIDTGVLTQLVDYSNRRLIVIGRTGAGKSALLTILESVNPHGHVIRISAEHLALTYIANSTVLSFFNNLGVNLDPFYKLLWRHLLTVEILSRHFPPDTNSGKSLLDRLKMSFLGPSKTDRDLQQAIDYLADWGGKDFWQDTEYRAKEITRVVESKLNAQAKATLGAKAAMIGSSIGVSDTVSDTEKAELVSRGQDIISSAQVQDLHRVLKLLDAVLSSKQNGYHLVIDHLDENWVEDRLRYRLIMALLQTAREFNDVRYAKIVVALRRDLIDRVFKLARDSGFQEEKYQSLYLPLVWTKDEILEILDTRINFLVSRRYNPQTPLTHRDLLPKEFRKAPIGDYIYSVARRPRDVIAFFNTCIGAAQDLAKLGPKELRLAEGEYSRTRLRALEDEWSVDQPALNILTRILHQRSPSFKVKTIADTDLTELCLSVATDYPSGTGLAQNAMQVIEQTITVAQFKYMLIRTFYQIGLVGLKVAPHETESWADELGRSVSFAEINDETSVVTHPAYRRALGIAQ